MTVSTTSTYFTITILSFLFLSSGGAVTVYAYFDAEPLPVTLPIGVTQQFSSVDGRGSMIDARNSLQRRVVSILSLDRKDSVSSPVPPFEGAQANGGIISPPAVPATTTTTTLGKLVVVVTDNGPGISAENQKKLFKEVAKSLLCYMVCLLFFFITLYRISSFCIYVFICVSVCDMT